MDDGHRPAKSLTETTVAECIQTRVDQAPLLHKAFAHPLNVVLLTTLHLRPQAQAHVILLSRDLTLAAAPLVDDDRWRFQLAFHVRDATPHWGREDCMHMTPTGVTHAANLAWFMVKVVDDLPAAVRQHDPAASSLDLPADGRGYTDVEETITRLPETPEPML